MSLMTETERRAEQARIAAEIVTVHEHRDELVHQYTARMQAETLPKTVLKLSLKLSKLVFELDQKVYGLERAMPVTQAISEIETGTEA